MNAAINGAPLTLHCKKDDSGEIVDISSRCWLHARNHADGLLFLLEHGIPGERYNITGEWGSVKDIADKVASIVGKPLNYVFEDFHSFRPGHDMHYGLDGTKMKEMGWIPPFSLDESLKNTVEWSKKHPLWLGIK
jgi:dTDP-glucose 4,6-dehydratase